MQSSLYKFTYNLIAEPGAFTAFRSFVFRIRPQRYEPHLLPQEATVANDIQATFKAAHSAYFLYLTIDMLTESPTQALQATNIIVLAQGLQFFRGGVTIAIMMLEYPLFQSWTYFLSEPALYTAKKFAERYESPAIAALLYFSFIYFIPLFLTSWFITKCVLAANAIKGTTPLHRAALANDQEKFRSLVRRGANLYAIDHNNNSVFDMLANYSALIAEFYPRQDLARVARHRANTPEFLQRSLHAMLAALRITASHIDYFLNYKLLANINKILGNRDQTVLKTLFSTIKNNDYDSLQRLFMVHDTVIANLNLANQSSLFAAANTIKMQAMLISLGVDFREYAYKIHVEQKQLKDRKMIVPNNQLRIAVLNSLLPAIDINKVAVDQNIQDTLEKSYNCAISYSLATIPVRLKQHLFDFTTITTQWGIKKINPMTNLSCSVTDLYFDLNAFNTLNTMYPKLQPTLDTQLLSSLRSNEISFAMLVKQLRITIPRIVQDQYFFVSLDHGFYIFICSAITYSDHARQIIRVITQNQLMVQTIIALFIANRIRHNLQHSLFHDDFLAVFTTASCIGIMCMSAINKSILKTYIYDTSQIQFVAFNDSNNLNLGFLDPNICKIKIIIDPSKATVNLLDTGPIAVQYFYLFGLMVIAHLMNIALNMNREACFTDLETYEFKAVDPNNLLLAQAKPMTFWKQVIAARNEMPTQPEIEPDLEQPVVRRRAGQLYQA